MEGLYYIYITDGENFQKWIVFTFLFLLKKNRSRKIWLLLGHKGTLSKRNWMKRFLISTSGLQMHERIYLCPLPPVGIKHWKNQDCQSQGPIFFTDWCLVTWNARMKSDQSTLLFLAIPFRVSFHLNFSNILSIF